IGSKLSNYRHVLLTRLCDKHGYGSNSATKDLIKIIERINPDIIHLHNIHGYYINITTLFNYLSSKSFPVVWTLHDCWAFTGHCVHFESVGCNKWETLCENCPQTKQYPKSYYIDNSKNNYLDKKKLFNSVNNLTIVPVSYWLQNLLTQSFLKNNPIQTIQNGIDLSIFINKNLQSFRENYNIQDKYIFLGVASVWGSGKGYVDFLKLAQKLEPDEVIVLVGLTKKQMFDLPVGVIGIEKTQNKEQLAEIYATSNIFLNLTYADTFPTTNLEALACGTPIITYNTGGSPEAISEDTGFVVPPGDIVAVRKCLNKLKKHTKSHYAAVCRERALKFFDKNVKYESYYHLYNAQLKNL
uniref:glycosyltransferase n=1 Tax=Arenibacter lacus TaxID=2608629 RepID=UPI00123CFCFE